MESPKFTIGSTYSSEDSKITLNESFKNDNDKDTIGWTYFNNETVNQTYLDNESVGERYFNNDTVTNTLITPKNETINQVSGGNRKQNTISTVAFQDSGRSIILIDTYSPFMKVNTIPVFNVILRNIFRKMRQHVKTVHKGVRYPCDQCEYKATRKKYLHSHQTKLHV